MDSKTKFRIALLLGIVILAVDMLWLYGSVFRIGGGIAGGSFPYRNFTGNASPATRPGFNASSAAAYGRMGDSGFLDIAYGVIILVADIMWMYLEFAMTSTPSKNK